MSAFNQPSKENLLIFDIDGTLTESVEIHQQSFCLALEKMNLIGYDNNFSGYLHHTDLHIFKCIFETLNGCVCSEDDIARFEYLLHEEMVKKIKVQPMIEINGAIDFVNHIISNTEFAVVYATGSLEKPAKLKLEQLGFPLSHLLVASNQLERREDILQRALQTSKDHFKVEKFGKVIALGDGLWDLKAAQNENIDFIGIGEKNKELLLKNGAKAIYGDYSDWEMVYSKMV